MNTIALTFWCKYWCNVIVEWTKKILVLVASGDGHVVNVHADWFIWSIKQDIVGNGIYCNYFRLDVESKLPEQLKLAFVCCRSEDKSAALLCLLKHAIKPESLIVVFAATKHHVEYLHMVRSTSSLVPVRTLNFCFKSRKLNSSVHTLLQFYSYYITLIIIWYPDICTNKNFEEKLPFLCNYSNSVFQSNYVNLPYNSPSCHRQYCSCCFKEVPLQRI